MTNVEALKLVTSGNADLGLLADPAANLAVIVKNGVLVKNQL